MTETSAQDFGPDQSPEPQQILKSEAFTLVEVINRGEESYVRKHYLTNWWLAWRTVIFSSRAFREFRSLTILRSRGVSCLEPISWSEERGVLSQVRSSTLITRLIPGATPLRQVFKEVSPHSREGWHHRLACSRDFGLLLRTMHQAGVMHGRASTKDFLVAPGATSLRVIACDMPYAFSFRRSILGLWPGGLDLFEAIFKGSRKRELGAGERMRILDVYTGGDKQLRRSLWRRLEKRPAWLHDLQKVILLVLGQIVLLAGRFSGRTEISSALSAGQVGKKG